MLHFQDYLKFRKDSRTLRTGEEDSVTSGCWMSLFYPKFSRVE